jgi:hypothetical protein
MSEKAKKNRYAVQEENALSIETSKNPAQYVRAPKVVGGRRLGNGDIINALVEFSLLQ